MLKQIPFNIELAKKVVAGEIKGKITCNTYPVTIYDWDLCVDGDTHIIGKITYPYEEEEALVWYLNGESIEYGGNYELKLEIEENQIEYNLTQLDFKDLHYEIVQKIIDFCKEHNIEPGCMNMTISDLHESVKEGKWVPATDSTFELYNPAEERENIETICFSA